MYLIAALRDNLLVVLLLSKLVRHCHLRDLGDLESQGPLVVPSLHSGSGVLQPTQGPRGF